MSDAIPTALYEEAQRILSPKPISLRLAIGQAIRNLRHERQMTLRDLQGKTYIALAHLSEIERGVKNTVPDYYETLSRAFGVTIEEFFDEVFKARKGKVVHK